MTEVLRVLVVLLIVMAALAAAAVVIAAQVRALVADRSRDRIALARAELASHLTGHGGAEAAIDAVEALPARHRVSVVAGLVGLLVDEDRALLAQVARDTGITHRSEALLRSRSWRNRASGVRSLAAVVDHDDPGVARLLRDPHPLVRAEAAEFVRSHPSLESVSELIELLDDDTRLCRLAAFAAMNALGPAAVAAAVEALADPRSDRQTLALLEFGLRQRDPAFVAAARGASTNPDPAIRALAVQLRLLLDHAALDAAGIDLLLGDPAPEVRRSALLALSELHLWQYSAQVAAALRDPVWDVRLAAGEALAALGPAGELALRRAVADEDRFAADMARYVRDLRSVDGGGAA